MSNIYDVLSSIAYDVLIFMKEYGKPMKYSEISNKCHVGNNTIAHCMRQLTKYNLIMKVNPTYFRFNARLEYMVTPKATTMLEGFEKYIKEYHDINENKEQLFMFNE